MTTAGTTLAIGVVYDGRAVNALVALGSAGVLFWNVITMSLRQALIPQELFGRVQGGYRTLVFGAIPVGALLGGVLADATSVPTVFVVDGVGELFMVAVLWRLLTVYRRQIAGAFRTQSPAVAR